MLWRDEGRRGCDKESSEHIFLELVELEMTWALVDNHAVTFRCLHDIVVDKGYAFVVSHAPREDLLGFCLSFGEINRRCSFAIDHLIEDRCLSCVLFIRLDIVDGNAWARSFWDGVPVAAQLWNVQVSEHDTGSRWATNSRICLLLLNLLFLFFLLSCTWDRIEFRLKTTALNSIILNFH